MVLRVGIVVTCVYFFFFQAEDGIRDYKVTGVQTCALPIYRDAEVTPVAHAGRRCAVDELGSAAGEQARRLVADHAPVADGDELGAPAQMVDGESLDHALDVRGVARVLDVEEDRVPGRRPATLR